METRNITRTGKRLTLMAGKPPEIYPVQLCLLSKRFDGVEQFKFSAERLRPHELAL
jgi:hypothetical protein